MPKGPNGQKRPADAIGCAVMVGRIATGEIIEAPIGPRGSIGGRVRADGLSPERRSEIAKLAAEGRWHEKRNMDMQTPTKESVSRGREAVCMYPNNGLGAQKKNLAESYSGFGMLRDRFKA